MFDDSVVKNNDNPATTTSESSDKLLWSSTEYSNVSSLGENIGNTKTGLFAFNETVKKSIKYMYLDNNKFSNVDSLKDFSQIVELQCQCNPNLSDIDGLTNHQLLDILTLHNCQISSLGNFDEARDEYSDGITGCEKISKLSVQNNTNLTSLIGIENAKNSLANLIANDCNITDIDSLKEHSNVSYLNLANNVNLVNVKYIQHCKALQYIYLDGNEIMNSTELNIALNGTDETYGKDVLIKKCINGYKNIPKQFWVLFQDTAAVLDYSYATLEKYLTVESPEWINLKGRTDITKLKLDNQTQIQLEDQNINGVKQSGLKTVLSGLTGVKALSLYGCSQVNTIDFVENMKSLYELDIRSVASTLTNLSILNNSTSLNRLIVNNPEIDATGIQDLINGFRYEDTAIDSTWYNRYKYMCSGYVAEFNNFPNFKNCTMITSFSGGNMQFGGTSSSTLDLSGTKIKSFVYRGNSPRKIVLPSTCTSVELDDATEATLEFTGKFSGGISGTHLGQKTIDSIDRMDFGRCSISLSTGRSVILPSDFTSKFWSISAYDSDKGKQRTIDISNFSSSGIVTKFIAENKSKINGIEKIKNLTGLDYLRLINCNITDISWISSLTNLKYLNLENNKISNISYLSTLENIDMKVTSGNSFTQYTFSLKNNNISDITPLATAIGTDGKINYTSLDISNNTLEGYTVANNIEALLKLHKAGLNKVIVTGNSFSENDIRDLKNGKTINNVEYPGFGESNVIN